MNQVTLKGNLAAEPQVSYTPNGKAHAQFTIACNTKYYGKAENGAMEEKEAVDFVRCIAWGSLAERIGKLKKGEQVSAYGRIQTRSWDTDKGKRYMTEVNCTDVFKALPKDDSAEASAFAAFGAKDEEEIPF